MFPGRIRLTKRRNKYTECFGFISHLHFGVLRVTHETCKGNVAVPVVAPIQAYAFDREEYVDVEVDGSNQSTTWTKESVPDENIGVTSSNSKRRAIPRRCKNGGSSQAARSQVPLKIYTADPCTARPACHTIPQFNRLPCQPSQYKRSQTGGAAQQTPPLRKHSKARQT